jgi:hypothetical protein
VRKLIRTGVRTEVATGTAMRTFRLKLVPLAAEHAQISCKGFEFLPDDIKRLVEAGLTVLRVGTLTRGSRRLQRPVLIQKARVRPRRRKQTQKAERRMSGRTRGRETGCGNAQKKMA